MMFINTLSSDFIEKMNFYGENGIGFFFVIDFEMKSPVVLKLSEVDNSRIKYCIDGIKNYADNAEAAASGSKIKIVKMPVPFPVYEKAFDNVIKNEKEGNSYLLNLTFKTPVKINLSLEEIFYRSIARYRLYFKNGAEEFVLFSPETFINMRGDKIFTYPIKGTIDAGIPGAEKLLLNDGKETAEHLTVVDLLRNDLNIACKDVKVNRFCFMDRVKTGRGEILQMTSEIEGKVKPGMRNRFGDIMAGIIPAGSVFRARQNKTLENIKKTEARDRRDYIGVFGIYDGENLKSSVMIRFIEKDGGGYFYRSGGGITVYSDAEKEYNEMIEKIYVPVY